MLIAKNMLGALSDETDIDEYKNNNDDFDFGKVLEFCSSNPVHSGHKLRCSDGQERIFSFD